MPWVLRTFMAGQPVMGDYVFGNGLWRCPPGSSAIREVVRKRDITVQELAASLGIHRVATARRMAQLIREGLDSGCAIEQLAGFHEIFQPGRRPGTPVSLASYRAAPPCEVLRPATPCVVACSSGGYGERLSISMLVSELDFFSWQWMPRT